MKRGAWIRLALVVLAIAVITLLRHVGERQESFGEPVGPSTEAAAAPSTGALAPGDAAIAAAFRDQRSDVWVASGGTVQRLLSDDTEGSKHQRFILRLDSGQTVLISHNVDLAPRVPVREGDRVTFRGEYEWNAQGGVIHWTHHDPRGRRSGGFLSHNGQTYR